MGAPLLRQPGTPKAEVAEILRRYLPRFMADHKLTLKQFRVLRAIISCRTRALGGHIYVCGHCGHQEPVYNSCGDRHCPKCQGSAKRRWLARRLQELLPVHHFHVVFTIPDLLRPLVRYNRRSLYNLLFQASAETLQSFGRRHYGVRMGFFGILHTWGQTLMLHPHVHYVVPAGGLSLTDNRWIDHRWQGKFLFYAPSMACVFKGIFIKGLKRLYYSGSLVLPESPEISDSLAFELFVDQVTHRRWNVHAKSPFSGPVDIVLYVGRYTHRTAISNHRIRCCDDGKVTFSYKRYLKNSPLSEFRTMELPAGEFIQRYLEHILPDHYHKIRFFGFMANGKRSANLEIARRDICRRGTEIPVDDVLLDYLITAFSDTTRFCPVCQKEEMQPTIGIDADGYVGIQAVDTG